jgi:sugar phosphate isomerase/epimerase
MKPAFSTVACPDWTLERVLDTAESVGAMGIELRTFGSGSTRFACEPSLTSADKLRQMCDKAGVAPISLGTSVRFDAPIDPPVIGRLFDTEQSVREAKSAIDLAVDIEARFVRVFGFELHGGECRKAGNARICERLTKAVDHCRNKPVQLLIENGGSYPTAATLRELTDEVAHPLLNVAYCPAVAASAGEDIRTGIDAIGQRLAVVKLKDMKNGKPCALGEGDFHAPETLDALAAAGFAGWVIYELDRAWISSRGKGADPDVAEVLRRSMKFIYDTLGSAVSPARSPAMVS